MAKRNTTKPKDTKAAAPAATTPAAAEAPATDAPGDQSSAPSNPEAPVTDAPPDQTQTLKTEDATNTSTPNAPTDEAVAANAGGDQPDQVATGGEQNADTVAPPVAEDDGTSWMWEVLTPFKYGRVIVKPPAWIEMTTAEARHYQEAGVLGTEPAFPPDADEEEEQE